MREIFCWICGTTPHVEIHQGIKGVYAKQSDYDIVSCTACGIMSTFPRPSEKLLNQLYKSDYAYDYHQANQSEKILRAIGLVRFAKSSGSFDSSKTFLELGSSGGALSSHLHSKFGMAGVGVDIAADEKRSTETLEIRKASIKNFLDKEERKFDFVFISHTLEHVLNPVDTLASIREVMKDSSKLVIVVPNAIPQRRKSWGYWQVPIHISHFNLNSLSKVLESTGFSISKVGYRSIDILGMGLTILNQINLNSVPKTNRLVTFLLPAFGFLWHSFYRLGKSDLIVIAARKGGLD